jgi:vitamin B12 transporter
MLHRSPLSLAILLASPVIARAQDRARDTARVAPIVVTATRSTLSERLSPASVTVLAGAELRAQGVTTVTEALRQVPGVVLAQTGSYGGATSLFVRGGESKFTKVLVDGVPVNDPGGAFDFSTLSTDNIDRIEIVRGPASVLYGSDAVAGVVQLFTRRGTAGSHGELSARGGGYGSSDVDAALRGAGDGLDYSYAGARHDTRGFQAFNSGSRDWVGSALAGITGAKGDAHLSMRYRDSDFHFPTDGSGQVVDSNAVRREDRLSLGLDAGVRLRPTIELRTALAAHAVHGVSDDQPNSPGDTAGYYYTTVDRSWRRSADLHLDLTLPRDSRLTLGGVIEGQWQATGTASNYGVSGPDTVTRRTSGGYAQLLLAPTPQSSIALGARLDHGAEFGDFGTWRAAAGLLAGAGTRLHASVGTAFRQPTFLENFGCCGFVRGNRALSPEHGVSVDAGIEQAIGDRLTVGATLFDNRFRDLIDYISAPSGPNYVNVAETRTRGLELEGRAAMPAGVHADASFTYLDARVVRPGAGAGPTALFVDGAPLLRRPMHGADAGVGVRRPRGAIDLRALAVGTREDNYFAPDYSARHVTLPAYVRIDLSAEAALVPDRGEWGPLVGTLRVENLFDRQYTEVAGLNYDGSGGSRSATGYRGAPRRVLVGARMAF